MITSHCLMDRILYQIFKIILSIFLKKHGKNIDKPLVQIFVNKIGNRVTFQIKNGYNLELLTPETIELLGSTENKITINKIQPSTRFKSIVHFCCK